MNGDHIPAAYPPFYQNSQSVPPPISNANPFPVHRYHSAPPPIYTLQQRQHVAYNAAYAQQMYYAQQRQYEVYYHLMHRRQQHFASYYQSVQQQYGLHHMATIQKTHHIQNTPSHSSSSSIVQSVNVVDETDKHKIVTKRKNSDKLLHYDKDTLVHRDEQIPNMDQQLMEWLCFTKRLWRRQKQHKKDKGSLHKVSKITLSSTKRNNRKIHEFFKKILIPSSCASTTNTSTKISPKKQCSSQKIFNRNLFNTESIKCASVEDGIHWYFLCSNATTLFIHENYLKAAHDNRRDKNISENDLLVIAFASSLIGDGDILDTKVQCDEQYGRMPLNAVVSCLYSSKSICKQFGGTDNVQFPTKWFDINSKIKAQSNKIHKLYNEMVNNKYMTAKTSYLLDNHFYESIMNLSILKSK